MGILCLTGHMYAPASSCSGLFLFVVGVVFLCFGFFYVGFFVVFFFPPEMAE